MKDSFDWWRRNSLAAFRNLRRWLSRKPDFPGDPHSYVRVPNQPRQPHLSAAAVAELPDD